MNAQEIANRLTELLGTGRFEDAQKELFHKDITSVEPEPSNIPVVNGLDNILEKGQQFRNSVEAWHGIELSNPIVSGNNIALGLKVELTFKGQEKSKMDEIILYKVEDGKIIHEQFFY